jgi:hypothetical protein
MQWYLESETEFRFKRAQRELPLLFRQFGEMPSKRPHGLSVMMALRYLRSIYTLNALDTRLAGSPNAPPKALQPDSAEARNNTRRPPHGDTSVSKWRTPEFIIYFLVIFTAVPLMIKSVYDVSKGLCA